MSSGYVLPPELYDVDWDQLPQSTDPGGLVFSQPGKQDEWVVKLRFKQGNKDHSGTGFYINIPQAESHIILTAGHNLIGKDNNTSTHLKINVPSEREREISHDRLFISASYRKDKDAQYDYGAILIPKEKGFSNRGFGFALQLGHEDLRGSYMAVSGYRASEETKKDLAKLATSTGKCIDSRENQVEYKLKTEPGLSGSPVYTAYNGHETVVAIHNNGTKNLSRRGSKGTRLNERVLGEIFQWANVGHKNMSLKAFGSPGPSLSDAIYLRFPPDQDAEQRRAWVRLGSDGLDTSFDIFPAYSPPSHFPKKVKPRYVFRFRTPQSWPHPSEERWVLWNAQNQCVTLTSTLHDFCFPMIFPHPNNEKFKIVQGVQLDGKPSLMELRMSANDIQQEDFEMDDYDTPEVSFEEKGQQSCNFAFYNFCFCEVKHE